MTEPVLIEHGLVQPHAEDVVDSAPAARWAVEEHVWSDALPDDVIALVAPPVVVCAELRRVAG
jgi:hypothetical protein